MSIAPLLSGEAKVNRVNDMPPARKEEQDDSPSRQESSVVTITGEDRDRGTTTKRLERIVESTNKKVKPLGSARRPKTPLRALHTFGRSFFFQVFMVLVLLTDLSFLIYEFATKLTTFESVTLFTSLSFVLELMIFWGYEGNKAFFLYDRYWLYAEVVVINLSFMVEYSEFILHHHAAESDLQGKLRYLRVIRFLRILIIWKTRLRHFKSALRGLVSADRRRYQLGGYDLDLTYVCSNIIAMSWPSDGTESFYRNHIDNVANFLDELHGESSYHVYNLCSERSYDESKFHDQVTRFRMDDHNPGELLMLLEFAKTLTRHIGNDPMNNIGVVHCKGGKGRTGTMTCAYLLYSRLSPDADAALAHFGEARTSEAASKFQGVESPSQDRYVRYFERLLKLPGMKPTTRWCRITSLRLNWVPVAYWDLAKLWYTVIQHPTSQRSNHYCSNPTVTFDPVLPDNPYGRSKKVKMGASGASSHHFGRASQPSMHDDPSNPALLSRSFAGSGGGINGNPSFGGKDTPSSTGVEDDWMMVGGCQPFSGNMCVYVEGFDEPMEVEAFNEKYPAHDPANKHLRVDIVFNTSSISPVCDDVHIKFFHNVDNPNPLSAPLQIWFHTSFEQDSLKLARKDLDGPHKDKKHKKWVEKSQVDITLLTVEEPSTPQSQ